MKLCTTIFLIYVEARAHLHVQIKLTLIYVNSQKGVLFSPNYELLLTISRIVKQILGMVVLI